MSEELYKNEKLNATFKLYEGVAHKVTGEMLSDVVSFFNSSK